MTVRRSHRDVDRVIERSNGPRVSVPFCLSRRRHGLSHVARRRSPVFCVTCRSIEHSPCYFKTVVAVKPGRLPVACPSWSALLEPGGFGVPRRSRCNVKRPGSIEPIWHAKHLAIDVFIDGRMRFDNHVVGHAGTALLVASLEVLSHALGVDGRLFIAVDDVRRRVFQVSVCQWEMKTKL